MSTELHLPTNLPYPITIISLDARRESKISRGTRLLSYSFSVGTPPETRFGTWDSTLEGTLDLWKVKVGEILSLERARQKPVLYVAEPCKHGVQIGGLCALCGKDMTGTDYTGHSDASRASIQMTHSANGPTVSLEEAQRLERETADHLLKTRRLSLIVDLDQTIVHATVDPTVGEWIAEGEAWEARRAKKVAKKATKEATTPSDNGQGEEDEEDSESESDSEDEDEVNPNWEALKDVKKFRLAPESFVPHHRGPKEKGKARVEDEGCLYYIKPRPGWQEFLKHTASKYEMHVYTMGTRAYAEAVCAAIDPDRKIFGGRILSRDESGSLTQKSLQRLFPCDTSMVVIIDDRADVWEWSPNLVKVIPYDFFVGIGDINSTFLPKLDPVASLPVSKSPPPSSTPSSPAALLKPDSPEAAEEAEDQLLSENTRVLEAQLEERPLAKKQEELREKVVNGTDATTKESSEEKKEKEKVEKNEKKALLTNHDYELRRVRSMLDHIHTTFYSIYDVFASQEPAPSKQRSSKSPPYDVKAIITRMRADTLNGAHIVFSSVIPLDTKPETTEIWKTAINFGATCSTEVTSSTTHVVAAKRGTAKVDSARRRGGIHVVWLSWFTDSIALWRRQDERHYLLDEPTAPNPSQLMSSPTLDSSDFDVDDWEEEEPSGEAEDAGGGAEESGTGTPADGEATGVDTPVRTPLRLEELTNDVAWEDVDAEVEAAMNESDTEDGGSEKDWPMQDGEEEDASSVHSDKSANSTARRKRLRSLTPSEAGLNMADDDDDDQLRSPLAKRKKMASARSGISPLKQSLSANELSERLDMLPSAPTAQVGSPRSVASPKGETEDDEEDDESESELEDDFLAKELEDGH